MSVFLIVSVVAFLHDCSNSSAGMVKKNKYTIFVDRITAILYIERDIFSVLAARATPKKLLIALF